jgi:phosphate transport system substrate-binding protein
MSTEPVPGYWDADKVDTTLKDYEYEPFVTANEDFPDLGAKLARMDGQSSFTITSDYPQIDGATAFYPVYAAMADWIVSPPRFTADGDWTAEDQLSSWGFEHVMCSSTPNAYDYLARGIKDIIFVFGPSAEQEAAFAENGRELKLTPIGKEAFVFMVNKDLPVDGLTMAQVRDIYTNRITNWSQLGGPDMEIAAFQRDAGSGSQTAMEALLMKGEPMAEPLTHTYSSMMSVAVDMVSEYRNMPNGIGYTFWWYATVMNANPGIKLLAIDGVKPNVENIRNGSYPLIAPFYAATVGTSNKNALKLAEWAASPEGQAVVEKVGYVGV